MLLIPLDLRFYLFYTFIYIYKFFSDYRILLIIHAFEVENTLSMNLNSFIIEKLHSITETETISRFGRYILRIVV